MSRIMAPLGPPGVALFLTTASVTASQPPRDILSLGIQSGEAACCVEHPSALFLAAVSSVTYSRCEQCPHVTNIWWVGSHPD
jgi:hypothetical protein